MISLKEEKLVTNDVLQAKIHHENADSMVMDESMFADYAKQLEEEDFEEDILALSCSVRQLVDARTETINKLKASAEYLDSIWLRCKMSKTMGTSVSVVGGGLTIAGGILTTLTAGVAAPVLIAGLATSSVGAATNIGTSLIEKILNSKQVKEMNAAFQRDKEITLKLEHQLDVIQSYKTSTNIVALLDHVSSILGSKHLLVTVLRGTLIHNMTSQESLTAGLESHGVNTSMVTNSEMITKNEDQSTGDRVPSTKYLLVQSEDDRLNYNPLDAGVLVEGSKVIGQNSIRVAGQVIIGISAAFMLWDAVDLGFTISDLVRRQGSRAARTLRDKAEMLEVALRETVAVYCIEMPM